MSRDKYILMREIATSLVQNETENKHFIQIKILMIQINIGKIESGSRSRMICYP